MNNAMHPHPRRGRFLLKLLGMGALLAVLAPHGALAQSSGPYVLRTFDIETLASRPGRITLGTRVTTRIEFEDLVTDVDSARQDLFTAEVRENSITLRANQSAGLTDLVVTVGGRTALFILEIDSELSAPRRYLVGSAPPPAPRVSGSMRRWSWTQSREAGATTGAGRPPASPSSPRPVTRLPDWVSFQAEATHGPGGLLAITYVLGNFGSNHLANDAARLTLSHLDPVAGEVKLPYTLSRVSQPGAVNRVLPGAVEFGTLLVEDAPEGPIVLEWPLVEIGPGRGYLIREAFHDELFRTLGR